MTCDVVLMARGRRVRGVRPCDDPGRDVGLVDRAAAVQFPSEPTGAPTRTYAMFRESMSVEKKSCGVSNDWSAD
jgi:hypothetical protein